MPHQLRVMLNQKNLLRKSSISFSSVFLKNLSGEALVKHFLLLSGQFQMQNNITRNGYGQFAKACRMAKPCGLRKPCRKVRRTSAAELQGLSC